MRHRYEYATKQCLDYRRDKLNASDRSGLWDQDDHENYERFSSHSKVIPFYEDRYVLVTGATGHIGKALIEKLFRKCPKIGGIYVLIRQKDGKSVERRLEELRDSEIFGLIKNREDLDSNLLEEKLHVISGDVTKEKLGIRNEDLELLAKRISVVFNLAESNRSGELIDAAWETNVCSCLELLHVCDELPKLKSIVHLSSAYSASNRTDDCIDEVIYHSPITPELLEEVLTRFKDMQANFYVTKNPKTRLLDRGLGDAKHPNKGGMIPWFTENAVKLSRYVNTYAYLKAVAENLLLSEARRRPERYLAGGSSPLAFVRPPLVGAAFQEPVDGFVDSWTDQTKMIHSLCNGSMQSWPANPKNRFNVVPIDLLANFLLNVGFYMGTLEKEKIKEFKVAEEPPYSVQDCEEEDTPRHYMGIYTFNFVNFAQPNIVLQDLAESLAQIVRLYPSNELKRLPNLKSSFDVIDDELLRTYQDFLIHTLPCKMDNFIRRHLLRQESEPSSCEKLGPHVCKVREAMSPITCNDWKFSHRNVTALIMSLPVQDQALFFSKVDVVDQRRYIGDWALGTRLFLTKEPHGNLEEVRRTTEMV